MSARVRNALLVVIVLLLGSGGLLQARLSARQPVDPLETAELWLQSPKVVERLSLSFDALVADVYWMRAIQHFGGERRSASQVKRYELLYPLLDLTTSLDPYFSAAYIFGSFFLAEPLPGGAGRPDLAVKLLERALQYQPEQWRLSQQAGFIEYWYERDFAAAAAWFRRAAAQPGAPGWIAALEATTRAEGGDLESSRRIWQQLIDSAESDWMRETARYRLLQVETFAAIDRLEGLVRQFTDTHGRPPSGWADLVRQRLVPGIPLDPTGVPFVLESDGHVTVAKHSRLFPLPQRMVPSGS